MSNNTAGTPFQDEAEAQLWEQFQRFRSAEQANRLTSTIPALAPATQPPVNLGPSSQAGVGFQIPQQIQPPLPNPYLRAPVARPAAAIVPFTPVPLFPQAPIANTPSPFQGIRSLGTGVARQLANNDRRASAAATQPSQPSLPVRVASASRGRGSSRGGRGGRAGAPSASSSNRAPRGNAVLPPSILETAPAQLTIEDTYSFVNHVNPSESIIRLTAKIYPPIPPSEQWEVIEGMGAVQPVLVVYERFLDSFTAELGLYGLVRDYEVRLSQNVVSLLQQISQDLQSSPYRYRFNTELPPRALPHEQLDLDVLFLRNRARRPRGNTNAALYLSRYRIPTPDSTISTLLQEDRLLIPEFTINPATRSFILHLQIAGQGFSARVPIPQNAPPRRHTCVARQIYHVYPYDHYFIPPTAPPPACSGGEESDSTDVEDEIAGVLEPPASPSPTPSPTPLHARLPVPASSTAPAPAPGAPVPPAMPAVPAAPNGGPRERHGLERVPSSLWGGTDDAWTPSAAAASEGPYMRSFNDLLEATYSQNSPGPQDRYTLRGSSVEHLAELFRAALRAAFVQKDFTHLLTRRRDFIVADEAGATISLGQGVEEEVLQIAFRYYTDRSTQFFQQRADDHASLALQYPGSNARYLTDDRRNDMGVLGALVALLAIRGSAPIPLSPALLQFMIHGLEIKSLHQTFVGEWFPYLRKTVVDWLAMGHTENGEGLQVFQSHFATWHDCNVNVFRGRTAEAHQALAVPMIYLPLLGPEPLHDEFKAFGMGFNLPCTNGFQAAKLFRTFEGGTELLLSLMWTSFIKSYADLKPSVRFAPPSQHLVQRTFGPPYAGIADSLNELVDNFLVGTGIPCPRLFEEAASGPFFGGGLVDLSQADKPFFRARLFCWAATGTTTIRDEMRITVSLSDDNDSGYAQTATRPAMIGEGKLSFRTCFGDVRVPASHLIRLGERVYDPTSEPATLIDAVHHWLLCELINAVGGHSML